MGKVKRLYEQFQPENYKLQVNISEDKQKFDGTVVITGRKVGKPAERLTFHQKELKITNAKNHQKRKR